MATAKTTRDKSPRAKAVDREDAVRSEYRKAGQLEGMVASWMLARKVRESYEAEFERVAEQVSASAASALRWARNGARIAELAIAREIRRSFPKTGVAELTAHGWVPAGSGDHGDVEV